MAAAAHLSRCVPGALVGREPLLPGTAEDEAGATCSSRLCICTILLLLGCAAAGAVPALPPSAGLRRNMPSDAPTAAYPHCRKSSSVAVAAGPGGDGSGEHNLTLLVWSGMGRCRNHELRCRASSRPVLLKVLHWRMETQATPADTAPGVSLAQRRLRLALPQPHVPPPPRTQAGTRASSTTPTPSILPPPPGVSCSLAQAPPQWPDGKPATRPCTPGCWW